MPVCKAVFINIYVQHVLEKYANKER